MEYLDKKTNRFTPPLFEIKSIKEPNVYDGFMEFLNPGRVKMGLKPITYSRLAKMLQHLDSWDKSIFLASCKEKDNPSAFFWWSLKVKKTGDK